MSAHPRDIDDDTEAQLRAISVDIGYGRARSMYDLTLGWETHVGRLKGEQELSLTIDPNLWNEHDYVAALGIRDFVERGFAMLGADLDRVAREFVARVDDEFISFTQQGYRDLLSRVADADLTSRGWWWDRAPRMGFILENMNRYYR